ncbi:MAG: YqaJ viral recombinase family protein [Proteobacteria bacterium]|nr:YqaJ viral recombinase family protein [Pseudomonadota bacterium]
MTRDEWLAERRKGLGGSDASAALGLNPWKTNVQLWEEKTGRREEEDISDKECVLYGIGCERHMRELFALDFPQYTVVPHEEFVSIAHPEYDFLRASLDGELIDKNGRHGVLEIKTTNIQSQQMRQAWDGRVPQYYFVQVLHYMLVIGAQFGVLKARLRSDWNGVWITEKHFHFERADHEEDIAYLLEAELKFWKYVETDTRPDLILPAI